MAKRLTNAEMSARIETLTRQMKAAKTRANRFCNRWVEAAELNMLYQEYVVSTLESGVPVAAERIEAAGDVYNFELRRLAKDYYVVEMETRAGDSRACFDIYYLERAMSYLKGTEWKPPPYSRFEFKCRTIPGYAGVIGKLAAARNEQE